MRSDATDGAESHMDIGRTELLGLAVSAGIGLLVGLQREWATGKPIGLRSFVLIGLLGGLVGIFTASYGAWILVAGIVAITIAAFGQTIAAARQFGPSGITTELAAIAVFLIGVLATQRALGIAIVLGGAVTLLLHWKGPMHALVQRIGEREFDAITRFILVTLIVLPLLPNRPYGPYAVLNPWQIWLMVVLIVSINLAGYVALKLASGRIGALLGGVLGGLVSSTATTVSFARRSVADARLSLIAGIVILTASALVYPRILIEVAVVAGDLLMALVAPVAVLLIGFAAIIALWIVRFEAVELDRDVPENPAELSTALGFALLYSLVLFVSAAVEAHFGERLLYPVALVSGLTDVDAITLSTAHLYQSGRIDQDTAWRLIVVASLANLAFKAGIVAVLGAPMLRRRTLPAMVALTVLGGFGVAVWP